MTYLILGSIVLIVLSAIFLVAGWITSDASLIWVSVAASVGAAVCLALAYYRSRTATPKAPSASGGPEA